MTKIIVFTWLYLCWILFTSSLFKFCSYSLRAPVNAKLKRTYVVCRSKAFRCRSWSGLGPASNLEKIFCAHIGNYTPCPATDPTKKKIKAIEIFIFSSEVINLWKMFSNDLVDFRVKICDFPMILSVFLVPRLTVLRICSTQKPQYSKNAVSKTAVLKSRSTQKPQYSKSAVLKNRSS